MNVDMSLTKVRREKQQSEVERQWVEECFLLKDKIIDMCAEVEQDIKFYEEDVELGYDDSGTFVEYLGEYIKQPKGRKKERMIIAVIIKIGGEEKRKGIQYGKEML